MPGGIATAVAVMFCGRVLQRGLDPRILIVAGMSIYMGAMWLLGHLTTQSGVSDTQFGLIWRGLGLGWSSSPSAPSPSPASRGRRSPRARPCTT